MHKKYYNVDMRFVIEKTKKSLFDSKQNRERGEVYEQRGERFICIRPIY